MDTKKRFCAILAIILLVVTLCLVVSYGFWRSYRRSEYASALFRQKLRAWQGVKTNLESLVSGFHGQAGIVVKDLTFGWQYSLNKETPFPSASMVKVPIMAAVFQAAQEGRISLTDQVRIRESDRTPGSGMLKYAPRGTAFSIERLVEIMITESDNTAANMLIDKLGMEYCNDFFRRIGLTSTNLARKMMAFKERSRGIENYTTARDMTLILEKIYRRELIDRHVSERCLGMLLAQKVNDRIPRKLPGQTRVAHKTGLERFVFHDAGVVFTAQVDFLICVLTRTAAGSRTAKNFIADLALVLFKAYDNSNEMRASIARQKGG